MFNPDYLLHGAGDALLTVIAGALLALVAKLSRLVSVFQDFPPHRHEEGPRGPVVIYPKGYEPSKPEPLEHSWGRS